MNIIGGVCLLLWGLMLLRLGVTRGFGAQLRGVLSASTQTTLRAFFSGMAVTTLLQSSFATILIISAFAGQGMIKTASGLAIVLGADIGTTLVAQVLAFDLHWLVPALMVGGFILFQSEETGRFKNGGRILIGLALMLFALGWIRESAQPLAESPTLALVLGALQKDMIFALLIMMVLTWLAHSSLAMILLLVSLAQAGVLPSDLIFPMVLGANLGGAIAPLLATLKDHPAAFRIALGNFLMRACGVLLLLPAIGWLLPFASWLGEDPARQIVHFHTAFNVALAILFLPFTGFVAFVCRKIRPDSKDKNDPAAPRYLDSRAVDTPAIALVAATRETLRMADYVEQMLGDSLQALQRNEEAFVRKVQQEDDTVDRIYLSIKTYMARLSQEFMDKEEGARYVQILTFATNLEHAGDVIEKNLMPLALKKIRNQNSFSSEGFREIESIHRLVMQSTRLASSVFVTGDPDLARRLIEDKNEIRGAEMAASTAHIHRLREGRPETIATSSLHMDIIRDLRRINTYLCSVAYPILEKSGELHATRLRPQHKTGQIPSSDTESF